MLKVLLIGLLAVVAVYDLLYREIPTWFLLALLTVTLFVEPSFVGGLVVGGLILLLYLITERKGIGEADILIGIVIGELFGWQKGLIVFSTANFLGLIFLLPMMAIWGKERMCQIPLVVFMVMAIFLEWGFQYAEYLLFALSL